MNAPAVEDHHAVRFAGIERLYGAGSVARLGRAHVCVVGVGGVGSWLVEALARSAVGALTLIDGDDVCLSNTNRQLPALMGNYGRPKVEVLAERARAINPDIQVNALEQFLTPSNLDDLLGRGYELVLDACDAFRVKLETVAWCKRNRQPLIVCGSAGGRADPTAITVRDLSKTEHDAMLSLIRKKLRQDFGFARNPKRSFGIPAVFSLENVRYPQPDGTVCGLRPTSGDAMRLDCDASLGAATHVTAAFGMAIAGRAIERLLQPLAPSA
ncbi:tRNA threonylcarbamoyladenosine dehydratase [Pseudofulvimonas gallinarii]|uniref:tRNA A37 threonylcarbamoyladenosine dehydratase n=1 Tax=Pseudofulvimonas gallinarii TaxID=634155 RepID=A0A4S3KRY9_9GAMM|nr:tRNA threonylcarbamoyladenosine dehydratase [Pseudofulvimonas gallinarii]TCT00698.1 tRNA A37 threonylcarbamoyladenosine dehydratase [Pseudofulvimonas gallinarii]THD11780.1 tRNA threonylcarbamoyladenosine dehydratase [Pseudofulvimonas gallinarii]